MWAKLRAFTLLEVLVAVAILGLGLTAILSAQFSAVKAVGHARNMNLAVGLVRCKMSEVEEQLRVDGFQELDLEDSGPCCEGDESPNVSCSWTVTKPVFPDSDYGKLDLDAEIDSNPLSKLEDADLGDNPSLSDVSNSLGGDIGGAAAGGIGGVSSMLMGMVYPQLKSVLEASTRRITVVINWTEGAKSYDIELVQWVTQPQPGLLQDTAEGLGEEDDEEDTKAGTGAGTSGGTGSRGGTQGGRSGAGSGAAGKGRGASGSGRSSAGSGTMSPGGGRR